MEWLDEDPLPPPPHFAALVPCWHGVFIPALPARYRSHPRRPTREGGPPAFGWRLVVNQGAGSDSNPCAPPAMPLAAPSPPSYGRPRALRSSALGRAAARAGMELGARAGGAGSGGWVRRGLPRWRARGAVGEEHVHASARALGRAGCARCTRGRGRFGRVEPQGDPTGSTMREVYSKAFSCALSRALRLRFIHSFRSCRVKKRVEKPRPGRGKDVSFSTARAGVQPARAQPTCAII